MKKIVFLSLIATLSLAVTGVVLWATLSKADAADARQFNAARIIDDAVYTNNKSMSAAQIQSFLNSKNSTCLKDFKSKSLVDDDGSGWVDDDGSEKYGRHPNMSAAQLIKAAADIYRINPQVILATLEKEQGLVTRQDCPSWRYNTALGYGCPDTAPCDDSAFGFTMQIDYGTYHLRGFFDDSLPSVPYTTGDNRIYWHPDLSRCGSSTVNIQNRATASLYSYTPYRPNQAALNAQYGTGNSCSSYGNRNFFLFFSDWFGSTYAVSVEAVRYDTITDKSGEQAKIGFRLSSKPTHNVTIEFGVNSPSNARIVGSSKVTITPRSWNKPASNVIIVEGLNNPHASTAAHYSLKAKRTTSSDRRYHALPSSMTDSIKLTNLPSGSTGVYRLYSPQYKQHRFTASLSEVNSLTDDGWENEGIKFRTCQGSASTVIRMKHDDFQETRLVTDRSSEYDQAITAGYSIDQPVISTSSQGTVPVYWRYDPTLGRSLYTTSLTEGISSGFEDRGVVFNACERDVVPVYRMYRPSVGNHFFTTSAAERNRATKSLGFRYENTGFYLCPDGDTDVHRLYKSSTKNHLLTTSKRESDEAVSKHNFRYEGVRFKSCSDDTTNVYRLYRPRTGSHFFTTSAAERDRAVADEDFRYEGIMLKAR